MYVCIRIQLNKSESNLKSYVGSAFFYETYSKGCLYTFFLHYYFQHLVGVIDCCILMDLKIRTKSSVISSVIFKSVLKSGVIGLMIHKFYNKSSVIQSYGFTNIFDFIMDLNRFVWIF